MRRCIVLVLFLVSCVVGQNVDAQTTPDLNADSGSSANSAAPVPSDPAGANDSLDWLFPLHRLNRSLPSWFRIGGEYRGRLEGPTGIGFTGTNDFYFLDRLRVKMGIKPKECLLFYGEVQDARIFFNHHIANADPYEDKWTLWQAYSQVGNSETGWADALAGRQVLRFGDERVIGPSEWLNVGRTFNVARVDLHHPGYEVSVFASSVVPGDNSELHSALRGNNLYGIYGSFQNLVQFRTGVEEEPTKKWKLKQQFEGYWLATSKDNLYASSGSIAVSAHPGASRHIGNEFDVVAEYEVNKGLNFGFGYARMFAGQFLNQTTPGYDYSYPYAYFEYNFSKSGFHFPLTPNNRN